LDTLKGALFKDKMVSKVVELVNLWMPSFHAKQHRTQNSDVLCQQRAITVRQIHREKIRPACDISPSITH
jgi:hypothetical protein